MNALRRLVVLSVAAGLMVATASPATAITASEVRIGESSQTFIDLYTSATPSFAATPPPGLNVTFTAPTRPDPEGAPTLWKTTMTIAAASPITPGPYTFPLTVTDGAGGVLLNDTVSVQVLEAPPPTTTTTTTTTVAPTTTTSTTTTAPTTTTSTTTTTVAPTTTAPPTTEAPATTAPPATEAPTATEAPATTAAPTTQAPATTSAPDAAAATTLGVPGAVLPDDGPPLGVIIPLGGGLLVILGWLAVAGAKRRRQSA